MKTLWNTLTVFSSASLLAVSLPGQPGTEQDIPAEAMDDSIMASPQEVRDMLDWATVSFTGARAAGAGPRIEMEVRRQDHNVLRFGQSCMETPVQIGSQTFAHGLGTHALSEIAVTIPNGAAAFKCSVGVDNNYDTQGVNGSVQFAVEFNGKEAFHSGTLKGGNAPVAVTVEVPAGAGQMTLKVSDAGDGVAFDQADWADARFVMSDGSERWLDEGHANLLLQPGSPPFSFVYGGSDSRQLLKTWRRTVQTEELPDRVERRVCWQDAETGLAVTAVVGSFRRYPAADWVLYFENGGTQDTPILEKIRAADVALGTGTARNPAWLHQLRGDSCDETTFTPFRMTLPINQSVGLAPAGGRPSAVSAFPFFDLRYGRQGLIAAVGWSGQWAASFERTERGPTRFAAGMEQVRLRLHPGEKIRSPRMLLLHWQGERRAALNRFRRLMLFHYVPRWQGRPVPLPVALQCFDRYSWSRKDWATEAGQLAAVRTAQALGCNTHWLDAAWFPGGFPNGVGNWSAEPAPFPTG